MLFSGVYLGQPTRYILGKHNLHPSPVWYLAFMSNTFSPRTSLISEFVSGSSRTRISTFNFLWKHLITDMYRFKGSDFGNLIKGVYRGVKRLRASCGEAKFSNCLSILLFSLAAWTNSWLRLEEIDSEMVGLGQASGDRKRRVISRSLSFLSSVHWSGTPYSQCHEEETRRSPFIRYNASAGNTRLSVCGV
jgi:hypothetical protein